MKTIVILILSFLLFSYSISAEEKNGAVTGPVKNSEIKVLEERINIQLKELKDELALKSEQNNEWFIVGAAGLGTLLGATLGAYLSYFFMNKSARRRRKEEIIDKQYILANNIISDSLKFMLKARDMTDNLDMKKLKTLDLIKSDNSKASDLQRKFLDDYDEDLGEGFYSEFGFHAIQLERLENQKILEKYNSVRDAHMDLIGKLAEDGLTVDLTNDLINDYIKDIQNSTDRLRTLENEFTSFCLEQQSLKLCG